MKQSFFYVKFQWIFLLYCCMLIISITKQSEKLRNAYYHCNWYEMPSSFKKALIICTIQAQGSLRLTAGKFYTFSLDSFTEVSSISINWLFWIILMIRFNFFFLISFFKFANIPNFSRKWDSVKILNTSSYANNLKRYQLYPRNICSWNHQEMFLLSLWNEFFDFF